MRESKAPNRDRFGSGIEGRSHGYKAAVACAAAVLCAAALLVAATQARAHSGKGPEAKPPSPARAQAPRSDSTQPMPDVAERIDALSERLRGYRGLPENGSQRTPPRRPGR